jgi:acetylcholinesterase
VPPGTFTCPGNQIAAAMAQHFSSSQVWNYRYNVLDAANVAAGLGVPHTFETPAIFGPPNGNCQPETCSYDSYNEPIVPVLQDYWISFVKTLNPNTLRDAGSPVWQPWGTGDVARRLKVQTNATEMENVPSDQATRCGFWRRLADDMEQ